MLFDFKGYPLWANIAVFAVAAILVWIAGTKMSHYADAIAERTGIGRAAIGLLLLGGITSLPEVAVTVSASAVGNADLAVNNLLGGVAMQVAILAVADFAIGRDALTSIIPDPVVLLQGTMNVLLLSLVAAGVAVGGGAWFGIGVWSWGVLAFYIGAIWLLAHSQGRFPWRPDGKGWRQRLAEQTESQSRASPVEERKRKSGSSSAGSRGFRAILGKTLFAALAILVAGYLLTRTGETLAEQTGIGSSFFGAVFVAISTSLPEVSTVLAAMRIKRYLMAVSDIFGTNLFDVGLVFVVDAVYRGGPILSEVSRFSTFAALLGTIVTALYLAGLIERRDRTILRMGYDSLAVLVTYLGGVFLLYRLR